MGRALGQGLGRFIVLAVTVAVFGMAAGWLYGKGQPQAAAGALIADFVEVVPSTGNDPSPADPDAVAPTSGDHLGVVVCGGFVRDLSNDDLLATLAAGVVVVLHDDDLTDVDLARLVALADERDRLVVSGEPRLEVPLVALGWAHRMPLADPNLELLRAFHTSRVGFGPDAPGFAGAPPTSPERTDPPCSP